ncbi:MAG: AraC family transcriptional regulator [Oscillospiraceae bacterium]|nr:AraC family transcriptional regulator [Oscillospiraceae bacterium]
MEKYTTFDHIRKKDIASFTGLENEVLTYIYHSPQKVPLSIECFGITYPNPNFHIKRTDATYFILEYIMSGKGYLVVDGQCHELKANDVYLLEPGSAHEYYADKHDPFKKIWVNFKSDVFFNILNEYGLKQTYVFHDTDILQEMSRIIELEKVSVYNDQIYKSASKYLFEIFMKLAEKNQDNTQSSSIAQQILAELDKAIDSSVSIDDICNALFISRSKMIREFKKHYHQTPHAYLLGRKIGFAKMLLQETTHSIRSIANHLGFSDEHYFANVFKQKTGLSPSQYRKSRSNIV